MGHVQSTCRVISAWTFLRRHRILPSAWRGKASMRGLSRKVSPVPPRCSAPIFDQQGATESHQAYDAGISRHANSTRRRPSRLSRNLVSSATRFERPNLSRCFKDYLSPLWGVCSPHAVSSQLDIPARTGTVVRNSFGAGRAV